MTLPSTNETRLRAAVMTVILGGLALAAGAQADDWGYTGNHAPAFWAKTPGWEACAGTAATERQSPIDIDQAWPTRS
jgi:carbonic anhydrase